MSFVCKQSHVKINGSLSKKYNIENGTPQGSSLSPLLFLIMINDINLSNRNIHLSLFAYDIAIWTETKDLNIGISILQHSLTELENWAKNGVLDFQLVKLKL